MKQCEDCVFYNKETDKLFILHDDIKPIENEIRHYCPIFDVPISEDIFYGEKKCKEYYPKQK